MQSSEQTNGHYQKAKPGPINGRAEKSQLQARRTDSGAGNGACGTAATDTALALVQNSPFLDVECPITAYELVKMVVMFPIVVLKVGLLVATIVSSWVVLRLLLLGHRTQGPMHPIRQFLVDRWIRETARVVLFLCGYYTIQCKGWENVKLAKEARSILVFNHETYLDAPLVAGLFAPCGVAKSGVASIPFFSRFAIALQCIFVERKGTRDQANAFVVASDPVAAIKERAADPRYPLVAIAPEATTKSKRCLLKFRRGAFAVGAPITPVLITYRYRHFNPGWGICNTLLHFYRLLAQFSNYVEVQVLPPIRPTPREAADPPLFAESVRRRMAAGLGVPLVDQGLGWGELMARGVRPNLLGTEIIIPHQS